LLDADDVARSLTVVYNDVLRLNAEVSTTVRKSVAPLPEKGIEDSSTSDDDDDDDDDSDDDQDGDSSSSDDDSSDDEDSSDDDDDFGDVAIQQLSDISDHLLPVSSSTGANIALLWGDLCACAEETSSNPNADNLQHVLREHVLANKQRRVALLRNEKKNLHRNRKGRGRGNGKKRNGSRKRKDGEGNHEGTSKVD
jgi:cobalamin biosynthesis protein CobT